MLQEGIQDEFNFYAFYVYFGLLTIQFIANLWSDTAALESSSRPSVYEDDERTPLLIANGKISYKGRKHEEKEEKVSLPLKN